MKTNESEMRCPHCGQPLDLDQIYLDTVGKKFEESNNKKLQEAIAFQEREAGEKLEEEKKRLREESEKKIAEAVKSTQTEQVGRISELLDQVKRLTEANTEMTGKLQKMAGDHFELQQKLKTTELEVQEKVNAKVEEVYEKARKDSDDAKSEEIAQLKKKLDDTTKSLDESKRKLEQGSQQLQGEVQELELEECLRSAFPMDVVEEVEKGKNGADVIQTVVTKSGRVCGKIVWESKNVKNWNNKFIPKLRDDMQRVGGVTGVLISNVFGVGMQEFSMQDGVWLVKPDMVMNMARVLRDSIERESNALAVAEHQGTLQEALYKHVTSPAFRNTIQNICMKYRKLQDSITKSQDYMMRQWKTQHTLIDQLVSNTQGIIGEVDAFMLPGETPNEDTVQEFESLEDD